MVLLVCTYIKHEFAVESLNNLTYVCLHVASIPNGWQHVPVYECLAFLQCCVCTCVCVCVLLIFQHEVHVLKSWTGNTMLASPFSPDFFSYSSFLQETKGITFRLLTCPTDILHCHTQHTQPCVVLQPTCFLLTFIQTSCVLSCSKMYGREPQITLDYPQPPRPNQPGNLSFNLVMFSVSGDSSWRLLCAEWSSAVFMWLAFDSKWEKIRI